MVLQKPSEKSTCLVGFLFAFVIPASALGMGVGSDESARNEFLEEYCLSCHSGTQAEADLALDELAEPPTDLSRWESVVRKLRTRQMPPIDAERPDEAEYAKFLHTLEAELDAHMALHPSPGSVPSLRRMTRTEYQNAIRDLLDLEIDATLMLPEDPESLGFDNITVTSLSPLRMERYLSAAESISRLAVGTPLTSPKSDSFRIPADQTQERHVDGLPLGTRGGTIFRYNFPRSGEYDFVFRLARDRNEEVEGLSRTHQLELLLDREPVKQFEIEPPRDAPDHQNVDSHLRVRVFVDAGPRDVGVTFIEDSSSLIEIKRQPYQSQFNMHRHPRSSPALFQVTINGPLTDEGPGDTPSRQRIFGTHAPTSLSTEDQAKVIIERLMKQAYRRPVRDADFGEPLRFFRDGAVEGGFELGIQKALSAILVNPNFLFRIERSQATDSDVTGYPISDFELASRMSFFLWSSIPDEELLEIAEQSQLRDPAVLRSQISRMLRDPKSEALATNFAAQWLHLRNLQHVAPNQRLFVDFDDNLRKAMKRETELHFVSMVAENRSVLDLLRTNETYLNERLARHYGIPHILGSRFRKVQLNEEHHRGGLLRQASILTVTSYATRTSPVIRGNWILENLIGEPAPPPPAEVPALEDSAIDSSLPLRERLLQHREDPSCASCHNLMDPIGFSLENYDAIGRWRTTEEGRTIDVSGGLPDGSEFRGVEGLETALLNRPELFAHALIEKLLIYSLGRDIRPEDAATVRSILKASEEDDFRFATIVTAIVESVPFQMRTHE